VRCFIGVEVEERERGEAIGGPHFFGRSVKGLLEERGGHSWSSLICVDEMFWVRILGFLKSE